MTLADYNGFTGKERIKYSKIQEKAIKEGILEPLEEVKCVICGQSKGIRVYHAENYFPERIVENSIPMCASCHAQFHSTRLNNPLKFRQYLEGVREIPSQPRYDKRYWLPDRDRVLDSYNGFTPSQRQSSREIIENAIKDKKLKPLNECECEICGQNKGLREYHVEDYSSPESIVESAYPVCWTCHQYIHHQKHQNPSVFERYVEEVKDNPRSPVYITNVWLADDDLKKDNDAKTWGKYGRNITKHNGYYKVLKSIDGKQKFFGAFNTIEEAEELKKVLIENDWDESKIDPELLKPDESYYSLERHYYIRKERGRYIVSRIIDGELKYFGTYDTKEEAITARDELWEKNWEVNEDYGEEKYDEYIYQVGDDYIVKNEINGVEEIFGVFNDSSEAIKFRNLCVRNNWKV